MTKKVISKKDTNTKFIFVVGGVMSGVGKGVTTASIGNILQSRGYNVSAIKMDPYINVDAGTMNPIEHGEVFVTEDGDETDQDIGNYERFLNKSIYKENYMTTGRVYQTVIAKERNLEYKGKCVQVVPHIPEEIKSRIDKAVAKTGAEIVIIEIGGTVGEYENLLFLEAARMMKLYKPNDVLFVIVSFLPIPRKIGEMKTKPTQHAVKSLQGAGIQPDFLVARSEQLIDDIRREKLSVSCNVPLDAVIAAPDVDSIYDIPLNFEKDDLSLRILDKLNLPIKNKTPNNEDWKKMVKDSKIESPIVNIAIVAKDYASGSFSLSDSYISVTEAIKHAGIKNKLKVKVNYLSGEDVLKKGISCLSSYQGIIIPQGSGSRGSEGELAIIKHCRENNVPYLGLCYGMQMAVIEFARNVAGLIDASSEDLNPRSNNLVIHNMPGREEILKSNGYEGQVRLGAWPCLLKPGSKMANYYKKFGAKDIVMERHRHRYEFNNDYKNSFEKLGLVFSGSSPDKKMIEAIEIKNHPFFIAVQFHPEYNSRPLSPHPLFVEFIKASAKNK